MQIATATNRSIDYHTQSVYSYGRCAYFRQVSDYLKDQCPKPTSGAVGITSLVLILEIHQVED